MHLTWNRSLKDDNITFTKHKILESDSNIYSMGSCFANELNNHLHKLGNYSIPKLSNDVYALFSKESRHEASWGKWDIRVHLQYFNSISILQEIERALGIWEINNQNLAKIVHPKTQRTLFQDPYRRMVFSSSEGDAILLAEHITKAIRKSLDNSDAIIITLGLIEAWETPDGRIACNEPAYGGGCRKPFLSFKLLSFEDNLNALKKIVKLLQSHYRDKPVILTVSPIPIARSFRYDNDIFVSNTESKSILRTVIAECVKENDNVHYFHSFEICNKEPENAFLEDRRHVDPYFIPKILETFKEMYVN